MATEWTEHKVIDLQKKGYLLVEDGNHGEYRPRRDEFCDEGVAFIRAADMSDRRILFESASKINDVALSRIRKGVGAGGDVILSHKGTVGKVAIARLDAPPFVCSPQTTFWRTLNEDVIDRRYLYYYMFSNHFRHQIYARKGETDMADYLSLTAQRDLRILLPPIEEQRTIAQIFGTLDDKIELNRRMNETLEAMARAIFKSWFVDYDPVRAKAEGRKPAGMNAEIAKLFPDSFQDSELDKIPKGWKIKSLDEIATYLNGLALQKFPPDGEDNLPVIKIAQLRAGTANGASLANSKIPPDYVVEDGDILFSWSGSLMVKIWCGGKGALNQHLFKVTSDKYPKWFYYLWTLQHLPEFQHIAAGKATTMGHIKRHHLSDAKVVIPPGPLLKMADFYFAPSIKKIIINGVQSRTLASIRDALLPKLLSGEIRIKYAEKFVGGVA